MAVNTETNTEPWPRTHDIKMAFAGLQKPSVLSFSGNVARNWQIWKKEYDIYMEATDGISASQARQKAIFLNLIGRDGRDVAENFKYPDESAITVDILTSLFTTYCNPRKNTMYMRYKLWNSHKEAGETVDQFATRLLHLAKDGGYGDQLSNMVRDRIVFGIHDEQLRERILERDDIPLEDVLDIVRANETTKEQMRAIKANLNEKIDTHNLARQWNNYKDGRREYQPRKFGDCDRCGRKHDRNKCPAQGKQCNICSKIGHFATKCRKKIPNRLNSKFKAKNFTKKVHAIDDEESDTLGIDDLFVGHIKVESVDHGAINKCWYQKVKILGTDIIMKLDSGSGANIINKTDFKKIEHNVKLCKTNLTLVAYGGEKLKPLGTVVLETLINDQNYSLPFVITKVDSLSILGLPTCSKLGLINRPKFNATQAHTVQVGETNTESTKAEILRKYRDVFNGIGCYKEEIHLTVDPNITPVIHPPRRIAMSLRKPLKETLDKLEADGIVHKVEQPTEWVNSLLIKKKKNGGLRLCIDPRDLNRALKREHYRIPTANEIFTKMQGMKYFTVIDQKHGFWNIKLDQSSSLLCTFNTPFGRYRFSRLPFGLSVSPEIFQRKNDKEFSHLEGVGISTDDFIIGGRTHQECINNLKMVLDKARSTNTRFNLDKLQFCMTRVKYLGNIVSEEGLEIDPDKLTAVKNLNAPKDKQGLKSILGYLNYMMPFVPNLAEMTAPLRMLNKKNSDFLWDSTHDECLNIIKNTLMQHHKLKHFEPSRQIVLQVDASRHGLGGCLMQGNEPVAHTSRALLDHETRYSQIEKEFLAITNACQKFHYYIYGYPVVIQTDHKPLVSVVDKPFDKISPRLQRFVLAIQKYDTKLIYKPGKEMLIADLLSRNHGEKESQASVSDEYELVHTLSTKSLPKLSPQWKHKIIQAYEDDSEIEDIRTLISENWIRSRRELPMHAKKFWSNRKNFRLEQGLLLFGNRIFIPSSLRPLILNLLHEAHQGIEKTRLRARMIVYWFGINRDIEDMVRRCSSCQQYRSKQRREPLLPHEVPDRPWQKVGMDIFEVEGTAYLLVVDFFSRYPEVVQLSDQTAASVVSSCKMIFARHGVPDQIISDNMPFGSAEFRTFCSGWFITLTTSSPTYSQSNGLAERFVRTVKSKFKKALQAGTDLQVTLLEYRNTPLTGLEYSPAQLSMNRTLKTKLPILEQSLTSNLYRDPKSKLTELQNSQKKYFDRGTNELSPLKPGQIGRVRSDGTWRPAMVLKKSTEPRSYILLNEKNSTIRRNRRDFISTNENFTPRRNLSSWAGMNKQNDNTQHYTKNKHLDCGPALPASEEVQNNNKQPSDVNNPKSAQYTTKSGRTVRQPLKFKDYVL